ncbi:MAG: hypothetical protein A3G25_00700 [Betaproteobacteria bacterium RIFCSPLOWO2_12_FULL_63_13]|nr:MAG: hypothetical protein A3H32_12350 [Betaproteobacteria bacterium RIFCSPLOWO2_02_FULL_63_19]OGA49804.1 MAG: hypothetical protein A3G25_00700 [Betaproteobacteria bacterium RIFCSPLOWO2_12_FULL_63_13]
MSETPLHRLYHHYSELPVSMRIVYTAALCILGMGYLFGMLYLVHVYSGRDGNPNTLSYEDLVIAYTGSGKGSRLESALRGPMSSMLPAEEANALVSWAQKGAERSTYESFIRPTIDKRCMSCHDGSNPHLANLGGYDLMKKVTEQDTGTDIFTLVRVSHIHLFGMTFIFFILGSIFSHAFLRPLWLKYVLIALPFVCEAVDISSWYLVKVYHPFAYVTMASGGIMGASFATMWLISMYQMWFSGTPEAVAARHGVKEIIVG